MSAERVGVREVVTAALAVLCVTPVVGVLIVRLRYGSTGTRTFYQQIAANRVSSVLLVAVLFEVVAITGFLIGAGIGIGFGAALIGGLVVAAVALAITTGATAFSLHHGDQFILNLSGAKPADPTDRQVLLNVVAELALAAAIPVPAVYVIDSPAMNAMSIGRDPAHASIAVTRGLLDKLDREELQGVIAHELAHIANFDSRHALLVALLVGAVVVMTELFLHLMVEIATNPWVGGDSLSGMVGSLAAWLVVTVVGLVFALTLRLFAPLAALAVQAAVSRDREYLADATAVGITRNPSACIAALGDLDHAYAAIPDASGGTQHLWIVNPLRETHPGRPRLVRDPSPDRRPYRAPALARGPPARRPGTGGIGRRFARLTRRSARDGVRRRHPYTRLVPGEALQLVRRRRPRMTRPEPSTQVPRRLRHHHLVRAGEREHARRGVDRDAARLVADELDLARVDPDPDRDPHLAGR